MIWEALLTSLREQSFQDFDVTLVDQNEDDRLQPIVDGFRPVMNIRRIRSSIRRNAHARNLGMLVATGDIIAFPDDDCIYRPILWRALTSILSETRTWRFSLGRRFLMREGLAQGGGARRAGRST